MVRRIQRSKKDEEKISSIVIDPKAIEDDFFHYHGVVVHKPWGFEYLVFKNAFVGVWGLIIKHGFETSLHCHPNKKTTLSVLSGKALVRTHQGEFEVAAGDALIFDKGVFHSTRAISPEGIVVLETETPTNKRDLVRLEDAYGRKAKGYEGAEARIFLGDGLGSHLPHFSGDQLLYGVSRKLGDFDMSLSFHKAGESLKKMLESLRGDGLVAVLQGIISNVSKESLFEAGDITTLETLKNVKNPITQKEVELLFIIKN